MLALAIYLPLIILNVLQMAQDATFLVIHLRIKINHLVLLMEKAVITQLLKILLARGMPDHLVVNQLSRRVLFAMEITKRHAKALLFPAIQYVMQMRKALAEIIKRVMAQLLPAPMKAMPAVKANIARQVRQSVIAA